MGQCCETSKGHDKALERL